MNKGLRKLDCHTNCIIIIKVENSRGSRISSTPPNETKFPYIEKQLCSFCQLRALNNNKGDFHLLAFF